MTRPFQLALFKSAASTPLSAVPPSQIPTTDGAALTDSQESADSASTSRLSDDPTPHHDETPAYIEEQSAEQDEGHSQAADPGSGFVEPSD